MDDLQSLLARVAATPHAPPAPRVGDVIGRYEITGVLGEGGFGTVYEARDRELGRAVALKWFLPRADGEHPDWLAREAQAIARLAHPNIVTLFDHGEDRGRPYLVLELVRGRTLAALLGDGPLPVSRAVAIALGIARALAHAHRAGVVHLDLKPSNVIVGEDDHATVLDFGLARFVASGASTAITLSATASALRGAGTPAFMAPEQRAGDADARTDVFATGILLYAMLTGELPFVLDAASVERVVRPSVALLRARRLPPALLAVIERALATEPSARHADGAELAAALRDASAPAPRAASRGVLALAVVASLGCAGLGAAWYATSRGARPAGATGTWTLAVPARSAWTDTGIDVARGQSLRVRAHGTVCTKPDELCAGPDGQARLAEEASWVLPGLAQEHVGALVGRIGEQPFAIGAERAFAAPATGRLYLGVNDRDAGNNSGAGFTVTVEAR